MKDDYIKELILLKGKIEILLEKINQVVSSYYLENKGLPEDINKLRLHLKNYSEQLNKTNLN